MTPADAIVQVLQEAGEPLHWTVIQDRGLRAGSLDPFELGDVRRVVLATLRELVADGRVRKQSTGVYALADPPRNSRD